MLSRHILTYFNWDPHISFVTADNTMLGVVIIYSGFYCLSKLWHLKIILNLQRKKL